MSKEHPHKGPFLEYIGDILKWVSWELIDKVWLKALIGNSSQPQALFTIKQYVKIKKYGKKIYIFFKVISNESYFWNTLLF